MRASAATPRENTPAPRNTAVQVPIVRGGGWSQIQVLLSEAESAFIRQALQTPGQSVSASLRASIVEFFTRTRGQTPGLTLNVETTDPSTFDDENPCLNHSLAPPRIGYTTSCLQNNRIIAR